MYLLEKAIPLKDYFWYHYTGRVYEDKVCMGTQRK